MVLDENTFSLSANFFGVIGLAISLFALARYRGHLPLAQLYSLRLELDDAEGIFRRGLEEELFADDNLRYSVEEQYSRLRRIVLQHQVEVDRAPTLIGQYRGWFRGLSRSISQTAEEVRQLRLATIVLQLEEEGPLLDTNMQSELHYSSDMSLRRVALSAPAPINSNTHETNSSDRPAAFTSGHSISARQIDNRRDASGHGLPTAFSEISDMRVAELSSEGDDQRDVSDRYRTASLSRTQWAKYEAMLLEALLRTAEPLKLIRDSLYLVFVLRNSGNSRQRRSGEYKTRERNSFLQLFDFYSRWTLSNSPSAALHRAEREGDLMRQYVLTIRQRANALRHEEPDLNDKDL